MLNTVTGIRTLTRLKLDESQRAFKSPSNHVTRFVGLRRFTAPDDGNTCIECHSAADGAMPKRNKKKKIVSLGQTAAF
jgi:hypothetical protein